VRQLITGLIHPVPEDPNEKLLKIKERLRSINLDENDIERVLFLFGHDGADAGLDDDEKQILINAALKGALLQAALQRPFCILVDDLHYADRESVEVLRALATGHQGNLAIFTAARPGDTERLFVEAKRKTLGPLSPSDLVEAAKGEIGATILPKPVEELLVHRAEGNPLFASELLRGIIETQVLRLNSGMWQLTGALDPSAIPDSLGQQVGARLDALSSDARLMLKYAALIGRVFPLGLVAASVDRAVDVGALARECENRGLIASLPETPGAFGFSQSAIFETVKRRLVETDAKHIHTRIADALEAGAPHDFSHPAEAMARHFFAGGQKRKAARYMKVAGERLLERGVVEPAAEHFQKATQISMELVGRGGDVADSPAAFVLELAARSAQCLNLVDAHKVESFLSPILDAIPPTRGRDQRLACLRELAEAHMKAGHPEKAERIYTEAFAAMGPRTDAGIKAQLQIGRARVREARGQLKEAATDLVTGLKEIAGAQGLQQDLMWQYLNQLGRIHLKAQMMPQAKEFFENAKTHATRSGSDVGASRATANLASTAAMMGDTALSHSLLTEALDLAKKAGDQIGVARIHYNRGRLFMVGGQKELASQELSTAKSLAEVLGWREGIAAAVQALDAIRGSVEG
jgi:tetratricopeptide (TPR) repeat protein